MTSPDPWGFVAIAAAAVAVLSLWLALRNQRRYAAISRRYAVLWGSGEADVSEVVAAQARALAVERARISSVEDSVAVIREGLEQGLQHVAVVRYDAFGDMGGRMSFSAAIIDDRGDGMVLSSIHARSESRTYAKGIVSGKSDVTLSPEERHALDAARSGKAD
ncbi:MAG: DUF4446 family protein [Ornithinimicrobium sp.]